MRDADVFYTGLDLSTWASFPFLERKVVLDLQRGVFGARGRVSLWIRRHSVNWLSVEA